MYSSNWSTIFFEQKRVKICICYSSHLCLKCTNVFKRDSTLAILKQSKKRLAKSLCPNWLKPKRLGWVGEIFIYITILITMSIAVLLSNSYATVATIWYLLQITIKHYESTSIIVYWSWKKNKFYNAYRYKIMVYLHT